MRGILNIIYILAFMFDDLPIDIHDKMGKYNPLTEEKVKNNFYHGKTHYQDPYIKSKRFYHNKSVPRGCRFSCISPPRPKKKGIEEKV